MMRIGKLICILFLMMSIACQKDKLPDNPYDKITNPPQDSTIQAADSATITGLHQYIFSLKCANPGCHDGTFEPDFRTVQSSWTTLVYAKANKTIFDSLNFTKRVIPNDSIGSLLYRRLITSSSDYMPSNGVRLSSNEIQQVKKWIMNGAKDQEGNAATIPNLPPTVIGYGAYTTAFARIDTNRLNNTSYLSFIAPSNSTIYIPVIALDTADGNLATDPSQFTSFKIKLSTNKDDFTSATTINCTYNSPITYPVWQATISTNSYAVGTIVYFRFYLNDGFQPADVEFPKASFPDYYKTYFSFIVQ
jgi:hypothetical protein